MACFLIPAAEAAVVTVATRVMASKEKAPARVKVQGGTHKVEKIPFSRKLKWLTNLLWGGALLLAFEHLWHGEISPVFPFLTAASDPVSTAEMLQEMSTSGVAMAVVVTAVWAVMVAVSNSLEKKAAQTQISAE